MALHPADYRHRAGTRRSLTGAGPIAAGDTARWIIGDTESGSGTTAARPHPREAVLAGHHDQSRRDHRPARLHDRAAFRSEGFYMPSVAWSYSAAARRTRPEHPGDAGHPGRRGATTATV